MVLRHRGVLRLLLGAALVLAALRPRHRLPVLLGALLAKPSFLGLVLSDPAVRAGASPAGTAFDGVSIVLLAAIPLRETRADGDVTVRLLADTAGGRPLRFLNGLALAAAGTVLVTDSSARLHSTSLGPVLPGIPDILSRSAEGTILVGLYDRSPALDRLVLPTRMGREVVARLPADWFLVGGLSGSVLVIGEDGTVQGRFGDLGTAATGFLADEGAWILGALGTTQLRRVEDPTNPSLSP